MITDEQRVEVAEEYYNRGILRREVRSYEVSLWTLQDEFITVLKWSDVEQQGRVQEPKMTLSTDGTEKFTFKIPMYLNTIKNTSSDMRYLDHEENKNWFNDQILPINRIQNPAWEYYISGNLIINMRKIKVIFNKNDADKKIFEFLITKVTEEHQNDQLFCSVECEGLAFHELGKKGYKISLSQENFLVDYENWISNGSVGAAPAQTVQYWCEKSKLDPLPDNSALINPNKWYYKIDMNWGSFASPFTRDSHKVYEEEYISSWDDNLAPLAVEQEREKTRPVAIENSNIYNVTQSIAEAFQIYCRYEYTHDENNHIIGRTVVFYNNYIQDKKDVISFTYPYTSKCISREMDCEELTTKLFVLPQDDASTLQGTINIMNSPANKTGEDYILNFDYLYMIGAINQEQYDEIPVFEKNIRAHNVNIENLALTKDAYETQINDLEADIKLLENSIGLADEQINTYSALYDRIDQSTGEADGYFERSGANAYSTYIKTTPDGRQYITFNEQDRGINSSTLQIYKKYTASTQTLSQQITITELITDDYGDITGAYISVTLASTDTKIVYAVYKYQPKLYYVDVCNSWVTKRDTDTAAKVAKEAELVPLKTALATTKANYETALQEKEECLQEFEEMMGLALREGYWQPEEYSDYGDKKSKSAAFPTNFVAENLTSDTSTGAMYEWDNDLFDNEDKLYYEVGVNQDKCYYPCIDISDSTSRTKIAAWLNNGDQISFVFNCNYYKALEAGEESKLQNISNFSLGGNAQFAFIKLSNNTIKPVIVLTGAKDMTEEQIKFMLSNGNPKLGIFTPYLDQDDLYGSVASGAISLNNVNKFYWQTDILSGVNDITSVEVVYPRIRFSDMNLKSTDSYLKLTYANTLLERYTDYSILTRTTTRDGKAYPEYFLTLKPHVMLKAGTLTGTLLTNYVLSNAATSVYLDALEISKNNAYPRASYTIETSILNDKYVKKLYSFLAQLVMINDVQLKFQNVFGYISQVELDLDHPENDRIEVKNYKTKFEDLFSTIVAQTDAMKRNSADLNAVMDGRIVLTDEALDETLKQNGDILGKYLEGYIPGSQSLQERLTSLFNEAGTILADTNNSLNRVRSLTAENAAILSKFAEKVATELTPRIINSPTQPTDYKVGDIWNQTDPETGEIIGRYIATSGSEDGAGGYTRTFDGTISAIHGASLDVDSTAGTVNILAENEINMATGGFLKLTGNEVDIVGNEAVNIGGATINIASLTKDRTNYTAGGINLLSGSTAANSVSKILMSPTAIEMAAANLTLKAASTINLYASQGSAANTSAISLDADEGIWIGAGNKVTLFSGTSKTSGANLSLSNDRVIFGTTSGNNTSVFDMTPEYLILGTGHTNDYTGGNITLNANTSITGMKLTKNSFGVAIGGSGNDTRTVILMNQTDGLVVGAGLTPKATGTFVAITGGGIEIGSNGVFITDTANFKVNPTPSNGGNYFFVGDSGNSPSTYVRYVKDTTNGDHLEVSGSIIASSFTIAAANSFTIAGTQPFDSNGHIDASIVDNALTENDLVKVTVTSTGLSWGDAIGTGEAGLVVGSQGSLQVAAQGNLNIAANGNLNIAANGNLKILNSGNFTIESGGIVSVTSSNLVINTNAGNGESIFKLTNGATNNTINYINIAKNSSGAIFAQIGGWLLTDHQLYSGSSTTYVALNSDTNTSYAMWAGKENPGDTFTGETVTLSGTTYNVISSRGAPFRVTRNGRVYMDKLMLWDSINNVYKEVDFSDFNQAVSLSLTCSGTTISAQANYWGKFNRSLPKTASASLTSITAGGADTAWGVGTTKVTISTDVGDLEFPSVQVNATAIAENAHDAVKNAVLGYTFYNGTDTFYKITSIEGYGNVQLRTEPYVITVGTDVEPSGNSIIGQPVAYVNNDNAAIGEAFTFTITAQAQIDGDSVKAYAKINGDIVDTDEISTSSIYNEGWNACRRAMLASGTTLNYYTGTESTVPIQGVGNVTVLSPYQSNSKVVYTVPAIAGES